MSAPSPVTGAPVTAYDALHRNAAEFDDTRGITFYTSSTVTDFRGFAELDRRARAIGAALQARGYGVGERVVVALSPGLGWADAVYGVLYGGLAFVPAPTTAFGPSDVLAARLAGIADASEAAVIITDSAVLSSLGEDAAAIADRAVVLDDLLRESDPDSWADPGVDGGALAYLFFTSGSTGDPKGVMGTHGGLLATARAGAELFLLDRESTMVGWLPLHHAMGLLVQIVIPAMNGGQAVLSTTEQFQRRPISWLQLMSRHRATVSLAGNFAFALCVQFATDEQVAGLDLSSLRCLVSGSEPVRPETVAAFVDRFRSAGLDPVTVTPAFGMTEAMLVSVKAPGDGYRATDVDPTALELGEFAPTDGASTELISCGIPPADTTIAIVDPDSLTRLPERRVGEIWISSPSVSLGYFGRPEATAETFGFSLPGDDRLYMRSGDLGVLSDGELYVTGRLKDVIILRGRNIYPQDIEAAAAALSPALGVGAAFEISDHSAPVGLVVEYDATVTPASPEELAELTEKVAAEVVRRFSLPSVATRFVPVGTVPRTPTGKVRRKMARSLFESGELPPPIEAAAVSER